MIFIASCPAFPFIFERGDQLADCGSPINDNYGSFDRTELDDIDRSPEAMRHRRVFQIKGTWMNKFWGVAGCGILFLLWASQESGAARGAPLDENGPLIVRLVHPDRQATELLRLFEGSRAASPAAALATWKQSNRNSGLLGKPLEAVIAIFNPDMVREWRILDGAQLQLGFDPDDGAPRWFAIVPDDDGTVSAAITAARLANPDDEPLREGGRETSVARLGRSGVPLAAQVGSRLIVAGSRADLLRAIQSTPAVVPAHPIDSGLSFSLDAKRMTTPRSGSLELRRLVEALHAMDCRRVEGTLAVKDGRFSFDMTTTLERPEPPRGDAIRPASIDPEWLEHFPADNLMAIVSMAVDPEPTFWTRAFSVADRIEHADPARAAVAPLRTRLNLLALAAGVKPEVNLWPHLRGLSAGIWGDPRQPAKAIGARLVLHLDEEPNAERLAREFVPRIGSLLQGRAKAGAGKPAGLPPGDPRPLGIQFGPDLSVRHEQKDVIIAWGDNVQVQTAPPHMRGPRTLSVATIYNTRRLEGGVPPQRFGAFWPGRLIRPADIPNASPSTLRVFADDPPVIWWGWNEDSRSHDQLRWQDLAGRVRRFLKTLPLDPPRVP